MCYGEGRVVSQPEVRRQEAATVGVRAVRMWRRHGKGTRILKKAGTAPQQKR